MPKLTILVGASGSGKSTYAKQLVEEWLEQGIYSNYILSTDNYFVRPDGQYKWYAQELEAAHEHTFRSFLEIVEEIDAEIDPMFEPPDNVILDNTNLSFRDWERYAHIAFGHGWKVEVIEPPNAWANDVD